MGVIQLVDMSLKHVISEGELFQRGLFVDSTSNSKSHSNYENNPIFRLCIGSFSTGGCH
jgi:hypothetical protein